MGINPENLQIGLRVYWKDPFRGTKCSGPGTVVEIISQDEEPSSDDIIVVEKDDGGIVEALPCELKTWY